jgi:hypothetical protein
MPMTRRAEGEHAEDWRARARAVGPLNAGSPGPASAEDLAPPGAPKTWRLPSALKTAPPKRAKTRASQAR